MREWLLIGGVLILLLAAGGVALLPWNVLLQAGVALCAIGMLVGVPTGVVYHVLLYRELKPRDALDPDWIWNPIDHNERLTEAERKRVLPLAYVGAAGLGVIGLGFLSFGMSVLSVFTRGV